MPTNYPSDFDNFPAHGAQMDDTPTHDDAHVDLEDAVEAIQAELGLNPAGAEDTVSERIAAVGADHTVVAYTSPGAFTFTKADYPWAKWVRVRVVGGGGGSGGCETTAADERAEAPGAGGGGFSEKSLLIGALAASETVTVGAAGTAGIGGSPGIATAGGTGGESSFGAHCSAGGGTGSNVGRASNVSINDTRGVGGSGSGGDFNVRGSAGSNGVLVDDGSELWPSMQNDGGAAAGSIGGGSSATAPGFAANAVAGAPYGGGASGGRVDNSDLTGVVGAAGGAGAVIVEVFS